MIDWDIWEWEDDPEVVYVIIRAVVLAYSEPAKLQGFLDKITDEGKVPPKDVGIVIGEMPPDIQTHIRQTMIDCGVIDEMGNPIVHSVPTIPSSPIVLPEEKPVSPAAAWVFNVLILFAVVSIPIAEPVFNWLVTKFGELL